MCIDAPEKAIFRQFLVGSTVSLGNIVIHALMMTTVVRVIHIAAERQPAASNVAYDRCHGCDGIGLDGGAYLRGARLVARLRDHRCRACGSRSPVFRVCELHDDRIRRRDSRGAVAADRTITAMNGVLRFGWSTAVIFRGAAKDDQAHVAGCGR